MIVVVGGRCALLLVVWCNVFDAVVWCCPLLLMSARFVATAVYC